MISKLNSNKFDVRIVYVFNVGIIIINLKFYSLGMTFFLWNLWFQFVGNSFVVFIFSSIFTIFPFFFPNKNCQVRKTWNQKNILIIGGRDGGFQLFKLKISPN